jgi:hypothetical protein
MDAQVVVNEDEAVDLGDELPQALEPIPLYCPFTVHEPKGRERHPGTGET